MGDKQDIKLVSLVNESQETTSSEETVFRPWFERTFGKMSSGSLRGSIFTMTSTAIGAGQLTLPFIQMNSGIVLSFAFLVNGMLLAYFGVINIASAGNKYQLFNYGKLVDKCLGRGIGIFLNILLVINIIAVVLGFQVIIGNLVPSTLASMNWDFPGDREIIMIGLCLGVMIPLSLVRDLQNLRFVAILCTFTIVYITVLTIAQFPYYARQNDYNSDLNYAIFDVNVFSAYSLSLQQFACHTNISQIQGELHQTSINRMKKVAQRSYIFLFISFAALGMFGYLSTLSNTPTLFILRQAPDQISNDWAMVIAKVLMMTTLTFAIPINLLVCRNIIAKVIHRRRGPIPFKINAVVAISILAITCLVGIVYPNILLIFNFLGGICSTTIVVIIPSALYIHISERSWSYWKNMVVILLNIVFALSGLLSVVFSL